MLLINVLVHFTLLKFLLRTILSKNMQIYCKYRIKQSLNYKLFELNCYQIIIIKFIHFSIFLKPNLFIFNSIFCIVNLNKRLRFSSKGKFKQTKMSTEAVFMHSYERVYFLFLNIVIINQYNLEMFLHLCSKEA